MGTDLPADEETPLRRVRASIDMLGNRLDAVERQTAEIPQLVKGQQETNAYLVTIKGYEATVRGLVSRGILLIMGSVGATYGVTRASAPAPSVEHTVIQKSATTAKVEACTAMQPGPERDQCAIRILTELMGPGPR